MVVGEYKPASAGLLAHWHHRMKTAMVKANEIDIAIKAHSLALRDRYSVNGLDQYSIIDRLRTDLNLQMMTDDFKFHCGEIQRFGAMIQAEFAMSCMFESYTAPQQREPVD